MFRFLLLISFVLTSIFAYGQLSITATGTDFTIDFDNTVAGVNNGNNNGSGLNATPATGNLDSDAWKVKGMSSGATTFGGSHIGGDYGRGASTGGVSSGGMYSFETATGDFSVGFQPTGSDWTPGEIILRVQNNTGGIIEDLEISYDLLVYNNATRSSTFNFSYSSDDMTYSAVPALDYASMLAADASPTWVNNSKNTIITGANIVDGAFFYLRWNSVDNGGSGSRDEFALDNIVVNGTAGAPVVADTLEFIPAPTTIVEIGSSYDITVCATNGTTTQTDYSTDIALVQNSNGAPMAAISPASPQSPTSGCVTYTVTPAAGTYPYDLKFHATSAMLPSDTVTTEVNDVVPFPGSKDLLITEVMPNPLGVNDGVGEYFEVYNNSGGPLNLNGLEVKDQGTNSFTVDNGASPLVLADGEYFVFAISATVPNADYIYPSSFQLSNSADEVILEYNGTLVSQMNFIGCDLVGSSSFELKCDYDTTKLFASKHYLASTTPLIYTGPTAMDFGTPGEQGLFNPAVITATQLDYSATGTDSIVTTGELFEIKVCASDGTDMACQHSGSAMIAQTSGPSVVFGTFTEDFADGCVTFTATAPSMLDKCEAMTFEVTSAGLASATVDIMLYQSINLEINGSCDIASVGWDTVSTEGTKRWECSSTCFDDAGFEMNGFPSPNTDWLISPKLVFTDLKEAFMVFNTKEKFEGPELKLLYSTDYDGIVDPVTATWDTLDFISDVSANSSSFGPLTYSGKVKLDSLQQSSNEEGYLAFLYRSLSGTGNSAAWVVQDVKIAACPKYCVIDTLFVSNISTCDMTTNTFTADVTVEFEDAPNTGQLILGLDAADTVDVMDALFDAESGTYTFTGVEFMADGGLKSIDAKFSDMATCIFANNDIDGTDIASCGVGPSIFGGLVINEVWNKRDFAGSTCFTSESFIELLVVASIDEDTTETQVNLQNWIIDPSNADDGHIKIASGCYVDVPVGALLVIYNADNPGTLTPDEMDSDNDLVYYIPSNSGCLEYTFESSIPGSTYTPGNAMSPNNCNHAYVMDGAANVPFTAETRHPHSFSRAYTAVYDDLTFMPSSSGSPAGSSGLTCGNIDDVNKVMHDMMLTPGQANDADNQRIIDAIRAEAGNVLPIPFTATPNPNAINYSLFLSSASITPTCDDIVPSGCVDTLRLDGTLSITSDQSADVIIITDQTVTIDAPSIFSAPEILLQAGFEVTNGITFETTNTPCSSVAFGPATNGIDAMKEKYVENIENKKDETAKRQ